MKGGKSQDIAILHEYTNELIAFLQPVLKMGFCAIFNEAESRVYQEYRENEIYQEFQIYLKAIQKWPQLTVDEETKRIEKEIPCLSNLIKAIFLAKVRLLANISISNDYKNIRVQLPSTGVFLHKCYINTAKRLFYKPEIFSKDFTLKEQERQIHKFNNIIAEAVPETIHELFFLKDILRDPLEYISSSSDESEDEAHIKSKDRKLKQSSKSILSNTHDDRQEINDDHNTQDNEDDQDDHHQDNEDEKDQQGDEYEKDNDNENDNDGNYNEYEENVDDRFRSDDQSTFYDNVYGRRNSSFFPGSDVHNPDHSVYEDDKNTIEKYLDEEDDNKQFTFDKKSFNKQRYLSNGDQSKFNFIDDHDTTGTQHSHDTMNITQKMERTQDPGKSHHDEHNDDDHDDHHDDHHEHNDDDHDDKSTSNSNPFGV